MDFMDCEMLTLLVKICGYVIVCMLYVVCWYMYMTTSTVRGMCDGKQVTVLRMWHHVTCNRERLQIVKV